VFGVAFKLLNFAGYLIDIREQSTGRLTIETGCRHQRIVTLFSLGPRTRIQFSPIVPTFFWRKCGKVASRWAGIKRFAGALSISIVVCHVLCLKTQSDCQLPIADSSLIERQIGNRQSQICNLQPLGYFTAAEKTSSIKYGRRHPLDGDSCFRLSVHTGYDTPPNETSPS